MSVKLGQVLAVLAVAIGLVAAAPAADPGPFGGLKEIEAFSDASSRGDQAAMTAMLADQVLFSAGDGAVQREARWDRTDPVTILVRKQTQTLREAAARGDRAAMDPLLDEALIYVNEDGIVSGRHDLRLGAPISPGKAVVAGVKFQDWVAHRSDGVVITSYAVEMLSRFGQQTVDDRVLALDSWIKRGVDWKLIESQVIPLNQDPRVASLDQAALNDYVGAYAAAPNFVVAVARGDGGLSLSTNGGKPVQVQPEAKDIFFIADLQSGVRRSRIIFQRDAGGHVTGYVSSRGLALKRAPADTIATGDPAAPKITSSVEPATDLLIRRAGGLAVTSFIHDRITRYPGQTLHTRYRSTETWIRQPTGWKLLTLQSLELPLEPPLAPLSPDAMNDYLGEYAAAPGVSVKIAQAGDHLTLTRPGEKPAAMQPVAGEAFFIPGRPRASLLFQRDATGRLLGYFLRREGHDLAFRKL
jgi:hypothetical protein